MKPETFFDNFEVLAEAPNGVKKLREMILQLAVRGKLVAQDERDEPASVLLKKIKEEKERLVKDGKTKKNKPLPIIEPTEIPFRMPNEWEVVRLGDIVYLKSGATFDKEIELKGGKTPYLKVGDMNLQDNNKEITTSSRFVEETDEIKRYIIPRNSIIFPKRGGAIATNKKRITRQNIFVDLNTMALCCPDNVCLEYLFYWFLQVDLWSLNNGTSVPQINNTDIEPLLFFLPPLSEQHRIVAKVDQLMSLCDELEARQQKKRETRAHLNSAALDRLLAARAPGEFAQGWRRISDNFDLLYDAPENVGALRQAILQLAVMGKLVAQDDRDEPAEMLMKRLKKEKKFNKTNDLNPIHEGDAPHEIPEGWKWIRLGSVFSLKTGATPSTTNSNYWGGNIRWLKSGDVNQGEIFQCEGRITEMGLKNSNCKILPIDSVLIALNGQGKTRGTVAMLRTEAACNQSIVAMISENKDDFFPEYLFFYLKANYMNIRNITGHTQRRGLNMKIVGNLLVALPPSNEQHRIVARVDQLMSLCDQLEAALQRSQADIERMMEAVVGKMLAGGDSA